MASRRPNESRRGDVAAEYEKRLDALLRPVRPPAAVVYAERVREALELLSLGLSADEAADEMGLTARGFEALVAGRDVPPLPPTEIRSSRGRLVHRRQLRELRRPGPATDARRRGHRL